MHLLGVRRICLRYKLDEVQLPLKLAVITMSILSGKYTITNVHYRNLASLPNSNNREHLICTIASSATDHVPVTDAEQVKY